MLSRDNITSEATAPQSPVGKYAIFTRRTKGLRKMHAVRVGATETVCRLPIGIGSGLVRDGDYHANLPCATCWTA